MTHHPFDFLRCFFSMAIYCGHYFIMAGWFLPFSVFSGILMHPAYAIMSPFVVPGVSYFLLMSSFLVTDSSIRGIVLPLVKVHPRPLDEVRATLVRNTLARWARYVPLAACAIGLLCLISFPPFCGWNTLRYLLNWPPPFVGADHDPALAPLWSNSSDFAGHLAVYAATIYPLASFIVNFGSRATRRPSSSSITPQVVLRRGAMLSCVGVAVALLLRLGCLLRYGLLYETHSSWLPSVQMDTKGTYADSRAVPSVLAAATDGAVQPFDFVTFTHLPPVNGTDLFLSACDMRPGLHPPSVPGKMNVPPSWSGSYVTQDRIQRGVYANPAARLVPIAMGSLLAFLVQLRAEAPRSLPKVATSNAVAAVAICVGFFAVFISPVLTPIAPTSWNGQLLDDLFHDAVTTAACGVMLYYLIPHSGQPPAAVLIRRTVDTSFVRWVGSYTGMFYAIHFPLMALLLPPILSRCTRVLPLTKGPVDKWTYIALPFLLWPVVMGVSVVLSKTVERAWNTYVVGRIRAPPAKKV